MTCEKHDYKSTVINHAKTDYTDQCETFSAAGTNAIIDPEGAEDCRQGG